MKPSGLWSSGLVAALLVAGAAGPAWSEAAPKGGTKGYAFTYFWYPMYEGDDACPEGSALGNKEHLYPRIPEAVRKRLSPEDLTSETKQLGWSGREITLLPVGSDAANTARIRGVQGVGDQCSNPAAFEDPPHRTVGGKIAFGMDLDGGNAAPNTCAHETFTTPAGEPGIDNQLYRILGCINAYRHGFPYSANITNEYQDNRRKGGSVTTMLEVRGIDNEQNDADVEVGIYSSEDATRFDSQAKGVWHRSLSIHSDKKFGAVTHGRITNGVLTSDPVDVRLYDPEYGGRKGEYYIRAARVRLELGADGTATGMLGGYEDVETTYDHEFRYFGGPKRALTWGYSCPSVYAALKDYADGFPDPKTGRCTAISTAWKIEAVPAFIIHPKDAPAEAKTAQLSEAKE